MKTEEKKKQDRIYIVTSIGSPEIHLVRAGSQGSALRHVVKTRLAVKLATQDECIEFAGKEIEVAGN